MPSYIDPSVVGAKDLDALCRQSVPVDGRISASCKPEVGCRSRSLVPKGGSVRCEQHSKRLIRGGGLFAADGEDQVIEVHNVIAVAMTYMRYVPVTQRSRCGIGYWTTDLPRGALVFTASRAFHARAT